MKRTGSITKGEGHDMAVEINDFRHARKFEKFPYRH